MKLFGYIRVSSSGQAKDGYSLDAQRKAIATFCRRKNHTLVNLFANEGVSGVEAKISERQELLNMLARLEEVEAIVVANTP